jgi:PAS domain S-box-containing protein
MLQLDQPRGLFPVQEETHRTRAESDRRRPRPSPEETARSAAELRSESQLYHSLLDNLDIGVASVSRDGEILYANRHFAEILGLRDFESLAGSHLKDFVSARDWGSLSEALNRGAQDAAEGEMKLVKVDSNEVRTVRCSFSRFVDSDAVTVKIVAAEVTELIEKTRALKESEASLQSLSARLLQVQDDERRRMARDLHDVTGQELAVAIMGIDRLARSTTEEADLRNALVETANQLRKVEAEIRTLSYVLHPPLLDEMGLRSALHWYIEGFSKRTGIDVDTKIPESLPRLGVEKETALFRVVQEGLTNVFRHAGSGRARVRVSIDSGALKVSVEDEGKGFNTEGLSAAKPGVGIQSMRDRLKSFSGSLDVRSGPRGTQVIVTVPLNLEEHASAPQRREEETTSADQTVPVAETVTIRKRVLIADDHEIARRGIRALIEGQTDLEICGEAEDGLEAVVKTRELKPDLLILDLSMPQLGGFSAVNQIRKAGLTTKILMYTTHSYPGLENVARAAGCDGFVLKSNASQDLIRGARAILKGSKFYGSEMAKANSA